MNDFFCLTQGKVNAVYTILYLSNELGVAIKRRLCEFGFLSGQQIKILRISPLKKTFMIQVDDLIICLRKEILKGVFVK